jgi:hypothetical protein
MPGFDEPLWDQIAKALADINTQQAHLNSRLATIEIHQASSSAGAVPQSFPYWMPGCGTTALPTYTTTTLMPGSAADLFQHRSPASCR